VQRLTIERGWLVYRSSRQRAVESIAIGETLELVTRAFGGAGGCGGLAGKLVALVKNVLGEHGIVVLEHELMLAVKAVASRLGRLKLSRVEAIEPLLEGLGGKWVVFIDESLRGKVFVDLVDRLKGKGLDYMVKTPASREGGRREYPLAVHVPSFLAPSLVARVGSIVKSVLEDHEIDKPIVFKPNVYAEELRAETGKLKPYIYRIQAIKR